MNFRKATAQDIPSIRQMADIAFRHTYKDILSPQQMEYMMQWMYSQESLRRQMEEGHMFYILSTEEGMDSGYVSINVEQEDDHHILFHLQKIYLLPQMQGKGLGATLLQHAEQKMKEHAKGRIVRYELNVNRYNTAVTFYQHMGMHKDCEGDFPIGNGFYMNDYIMAKEL